MMLEVSGINKLHGLTGGTEEKLPVVELRPFLQHSWRPSNSVAPVEKSSINYNLVPRKTYYSSSSYLDASGTTPKKSDDCLRVHTNAALRRGKTVPSPDKQPLVSQDLREKSILGEMKYANSTWSTGQSIYQEEQKCDRHGQSNYKNESVIYSSELPSDVGESEIKIQGRHMGLDTNTMYTRPWNFYRMSHATGSGHSSKAPITGHVTLSGMYMHIDQIPNTFMDQKIYDAFDRSKTLPSIKVGNAPMRRRKHLDKLDTTDTNMDHRSSPIQQPKAYRLGVTNTLDFLQQFGKPAHVEKHLTIELKNALDIMRKTRDPNGAVVHNISQKNNTVPSKYIGSPTKGENSIKTGLHSNTKTSSGITKSVKSKAHTIDTLSLSRCSTLYRTELEGKRLILNSGDTPITFKSEEKSPTTPKLHAINLNRLPKDTPRTMKDDIDDTWILPPPSRDPPPLIPSLSIIMPQISETDSAGKSTRGFTPDSYVEILKQTQTELITDVKPTDNIHPQCDILSNPPGTPISVSELYV